MLQLKRAGANTMGDNGFSNAFLARQQGKNFTQEQLQTEWLRKQDGLPVLIGVDFAKAESRMSWMSISSDGLMYVYNECAEIPAAAWTKISIGLTTKGHDMSNSLNSRIDWTKPLRTNEGYAAQFVRMAKEHPADYYTRLVKVSNQEPLQRYTEDGKYLKDRIDDRDLRNVEPVGSTLAPPVAQVTAPSLDWSKPLEIRQNTCSSVWLAGEVVYQETVGTSVDGDTRIVKTKDVLLRDNGAIVHLVNNYGSGANANGCVGLLVRNQQPKTGVYYTAVMTYSNGEVWGYGKFPSAEKARTYAERLCARSSNSNRHWLVGIKKVVITEGEFDL